MASKVHASTATALPDIDERLSRYEWERMNIPDLTGTQVVGFTGYLTFYDNGA